MFWQFQFLLWLPSRLLVQVGGSLALTVVGFVGISPYVINTLHTFNHSGTMYDHEPVDSTHCDLRIKSTRNMKWIICPRFTT
ncbi:hypothetical protein ACS0TY_013083 [Phlomoides rotata]